MQLPVGLLLSLNLATLLLGGTIGSCATEAPAAADGPLVHDDRLALSLFASDPDVVTPIGLAIDDQDRLFVLESHTHTPPSDYDGPSSDRVKRLVDHDRDGTADDVSIFAEGIDDGMNLAFSPDGALFVVTSRSVWVLHDRDGDGVSEARDRVLYMVQPENVYDHAGLLGITFSLDGWMYVSRGNTGGLDWRIEGTDGSHVSGYGDGGNIIRSRADGSDVQEVATGFWNPFDLTFDGHGRLLAVDNDPDSRGPNRLVHVVQGGDYGYKSLYGGSGIHPYLAWNGELPGTLPYAVGLGEAPSGVLDAARAALPPDYRGSVLATIWEERSIVRANLSPKGVSLTGETEVLIEGNEQFHPVALATDTEGTIYFTDWMLRQYPNHGRGRIWRLAAKPGTDVVPPRPAFAEPAPDAGREVLNTLYTAATPADFDRLKTALSSDDPFVRHAAVTALAQPVYRDQVLEATLDQHPDARLGALLALQRSGDQTEAVARRLLADSDPRVRRMALIWIGRTSMVALLPDVERALNTGTMSAELFETYLATIRHLQPAFVEAYRTHAKENSQDLERVLPARFIETLVEDASRSAAVRALALIHLEEPADHLNLLTQLARSAPDDTLRLEAIRTLAGVPRPEAAEVLLGIVQQTSNPADLRAEALLALGRQPGNAADAVAPMLADEAPDVRLEAARYLRTQAPGEAARAAVQEAYAALGDDPSDRAVAEQLALGLAGTGIEPLERPKTLAEWQASLDHGGNPGAGRRVFFAAQSLCAQCHTYAGRGGDFGPDLSNIGASKSREQLILAVMRPSEEIAPEWQGWFVKTSDGQTHTGRQIDVGGQSQSVELYTLDGRFETYRDVTDFGPLDASLMPEGLEQQLTVSDLRDLIAFLEAGTD